MCISDIHFAKLYRSDIFLNDAKNVVHIRRHVKVPIGLKIVGINLSSILCDIFYNFSEVPYIIIERLIVFNLLVIFIIFCKTMLISIIYP